MIKKIIVMSIIFLFITLSFQVVSAQENIRVEVLTNSPDYHMMFVLDNELPRYIINEVFYVDSYAHKFSASYTAHDTYRNVFVVFDHWEKWNEQSNSFVRIDESQYLNDMTINDILTGLNDCYMACYNYSTSETPPILTPSPSPTIIPTTVPISTTIPISNSSVIPTQESLFTIDSQTLNTIILIAIVAVIIVVILNVLSSKEQKTLRSI